MTRFSRVLLLTFDGSIPVNTSKMSVMPVERGKEIGRMKQSGLHSVLHVK